MTNTPPHDEMQSNKAKETTVTSSNLQLFASLADHDIFYRWQRVHNNTNSDNMTNHSRKTRSVDKKAPKSVNTDSGKSKITVNHWIILRPNSTNFCDNRNQSDENIMKGRTGIIEKY